jgi:hypothetical protein
MSTRKPKKRQLALLLSQEEMALLLAVQDALRPTFGDLSYAAVIRYGLRLAAAHLGIDGPEPIPLPPDPRKPELANPPPAPAKR